MRLDGRLAGRAIPASLERRSAPAVTERFSVGGTSATPVGEKTKRGGEIAAVGRQGVGHPRRALLIRSRHDDPLALEPAKTVGEDVRGDAGNSFAQRPETLRPIEQGLDEQEAPAVADSIERRLERRARAVRMRWEPWPRW